MLEVHAGQPPIYFLLDLRGLSSHCNLMVGNGKQPDPAGPARNRRLTSSRAGSSLNDAMHINGGQLPYRPTLVRG